MTSFNAKGREFSFLKCGGGGGGAGAKCLSVDTFKHISVIKFIIIVNSPKVTINRVRPKKFNNMPTYM